MSENSRHEQHWHKHCTDVSDEQLPLVWEVPVHFLSQHSAALSPQLRGCQEDNHISAQMMSHVSKVWIWYDNGIVDVSEKYQKEKQSAACLCIVVINSCVIQLLLVFLFVFFFLQFYGYPRRRNELSSGEEGCHFSC